MKNKVPQRKNNRFMSPKELFGKVLSGMNEQSRNREYNQDRDLKKIEKLTNSEKSK